jgi:tetratricopeptide (TPR) repeat protein
MLDARGKVWVTDFGLARLESAASVTGTGDLVGTLRYMSPEQALAKRAVIDHRTDVYSLGATLYEVLTLQPAFTGNDREELLRQIACEEPKPPRRLDRAIPRELETIVLKALEKDPANRYATAQELADDLERWLKDEPIRARRPTLVQRARKWARRHRALVGSIAAVLTSAALILAGSVGWMARDHAARQHEADGKVREALEAAGPGLQQGNSWDPALIAAAQQAEAQLGSGLLSPEMRRQAEQLQKDVHMLAALELIRLDRAEVRDGHFHDTSRSDAQYTSAFREYGIDVETLEPEAAAALVQASMIREHLVAGLDDWVKVLLGLRQEESTRKGERLLNLARQVDAEDKWRNQLRDLLLRRDVRAIRELARTAPVEELPSGTLGLLGDWVWNAVESGATVSEPTLQVLRRAQQRFPADFWINHNLAVALTKAEPPRWDEAIGFFRVTVALRPLSPGTHSSLGAALYNKGDLDGAIAECQKAIRLKSDYAPPHNNLGLCLVKKGDLNGAIAECKKAIAINNCSEGHCSLGVALHHKGDLDGAIDEFKTAITIKDANNVAHSNLGLCLVEKGDLNGAIDECNRALAINNDYAEAHINLGVALYHKVLHHKGEDLDRAIAEFMTAIKIKDDFPEAHHNLGLCLDRKGKRNEAIAEFKKAIATKNDFFLAHLNLGLCLNKEEDWNGAIAAFNKAIALKKDDADAHKNLGIALRHKGDLKGAIDECQKAIDIKNDYAEAYCALGNALHDNKDVNRAITAYKKAIDLKDDFFEAHYNLGNALRDKRLLDEAITEYKKAINLNKDSAGKDSAGPYNNLGNALCAQGLFDEAIKAYQEAVRRDKDSATAHNNLGNALKAQLRFDEAIKEYRDAIYLKPDYAEAHNNFGHALMAQGRFQQAADEFRLGHRLGSKHPGKPDPSAQWLRDAEWLAQLDPRLPKILKGKEQPADAEERIRLASLCQLPCKQLNAAAVRFYVEAFAAERKLAEDLGTQHRYDAACAAALAGCGRGKDASDLPDKVRWGLRRRALTWLRADLAAYRRLLETDTGKFGPMVRERVQHWQQDSDFAGVRDPQALAKLPDAEQQDWQKLWADVKELLTRAEGKSPGPEK